jgi:hypothetical protein
MKKIRSIWSATTRIKKMNTVRTLVRPYIARVKAIICII